MEIPKHGSLRQARRDILPFRATLHVDPLPHNRRCSRAGPNGLALRSRQRETIGTSQEKPKPKLEASLKLARKAAKAGSEQLSDTLGGSLRMRVIVVLAAIMKILGRSL